MQRIPIGEVTRFGYVRLAEALIEFKFLFTLRLGYDRLVYVKSYYIRLGYINY